MIEVYPRMDEPTYEELEHRCIRLDGSLKEARRNCRETAAWNAAFLAMTVISTTLLVLTWSGYIAI